MVTFRSNACIFRCISRKPNISVTLLLSENSKTIILLTLWRCDICLVQRVNDAGVIFTKRQVLYQMGHVYLEHNRD